MGVVPTGPQPIQPNNTLPPGQGVMASLDQSTLQYPGPVDVTNPAAQLGSQFPKASVVTRGKVLAALPAMNMYRVACSGNLVVTAQAVSVSAGSSSFRAASTQTVTLHAGADVWVVVEVEGGNNAFIIGSAHVPVPNASFTRTISQYPQVSGLKFDSDSARSPQSTEASIAQDMNRFVRANNNAGLADAVSGDWAVTNFNSGGVGVEAFRVWVTGGPMTGITFFCDEELTRVVGTNYELMTMAEEYEDRIMGRSLVSIKRRVDFPSDALQDQQPNLIEVNGQAFAGSGSYLSYRSNDNPGQNGSGLEREKQRAALFSEYRGTDGTYVLTSASSITLQKWAGVLMPIEVINRSAEKNLEDFPGVAAGAGKSGTDFFEPADQVPRRATIDGDEDVELLKGSILNKSRSIHDSLTGPLSVLDFVADIISQQAGAAFASTSMWKLSTDGAASLPKFMRKGNELRPIDEVNADPGMWKRLPKFFAINLNSYGRSKRFYLGRAVISITEEGGIVLQDAWGSRILMTGGNIELSAEHAIIRNAGTDSIDISGRDHSITAHRNFESLASYGRATVASATQMSIIGGQSGDGGLVLHCQAKNSAMIMSGDGNNPMYGGGLVLRSEGSVTVIGATSTNIAARQGAVNIESQSGILFISGYLSGAFTPTGMWMSDDGTSLRLSPSGSVLPTLNVTRNLITYGTASLLDNYESISAEEHSPVAALRRAADEAFSSPAYTNPGRDGAVMPGYLSSGDYGAISSRFTLIGPAWQSRLEGAEEGNTLQLTCRWDVQTVNNGQPFPGKQVWASALIVKPAYLNYTDNYTGTGYGGTTAGQLLRGI